MHMVDWASQLARLTAMGQTEQVAYRPKGQPARTITAMVDRNGAASLTGGGISAEEIQVTVLNSQTAGIDPSTMDVNGDQLLVAARLGDTPAWRRVRRVLFQDADFVGAVV